MNWVAIGTIAEVTGAIAVVVSLIYLAVQVRSSSSSFKTSLRDTAFRTMMEWNYHMMADPDLGWAFQKACKDYDSLDERDRARMIHVFYSFMKVFENLYLHYVEGSVEKELWERNYEILSVYAAQPGAQHYLNSRMQIFHPRFQDLLKRMDQPEVVPGHIVARVGEPDSTG